MAGALIDRLLHHWHTVNIRGDSHRTRLHFELWNALDSQAEELEKPTPKGMRERREPRTS